MLWCRSHEWPRSIRWPGSRSGRSAGRIWDQSDAESCQCSSPRPPSLRQPPPAPLTEHLQRGPVNTEWDHSPLLSGLLCGSTLLRAESEPSPLPTRPHSAWPAPSALSSSHSPRSSQKHLHLRAFALLPPFLERASAPLPGGLTLPRGSLSCVTPVGTEAPTLPLRPVPPEAYPRAPCLLPGCVSSTWSGEPLSAPSQLRSGCCLRRGWGAGGRLPGITQPAAVPTAGAGAWQPGSHDERLGRESAKSLRSPMGTSCYRLRRLPRRGRSTGRGWVGRRFLAGAHPPCGSP